MAVSELRPPAPAPLPRRAPGEYHPPGALPQHPRQVQRGLREGVQDTQGLDTQKVRAHKAASVHHRLHQGMAQ